MDTLFFWISKLAWKLIAPDIVLLLLILLGCALLFLGKERVAKKVLAASCVLLIIVSLIPLYRVMLHPLETRFPTNPPLPQHLDGIVVLSGSEDPYLSSRWNQAIVGGTAERNLTFLAMARKYPEARLVFSGGASSLSQTGQEYKAADVAKKMFYDQGLDLDRVTFERESRNTFENAALTKKLVQPGEGEQWLLITTAWHMPRAIGIFCKQAWPMIPYPVDHATAPEWRDSLHLSLNFSLAGNLRNLNIATREWIGLSAYYLTGKTTELFPAGCN